MPNEHSDDNSTALLRIAGIPVKILESAGNPGLFAQLREQAKSQSEYAVFSVSLADRLGADIIPHPDLAKEDRREVLALRRRLHKAGEITAAHLASVTTIKALKPDLAEDLHYAARWSEDLQHLAESIELAVEAESARLEELPWRLVNSSTIARRAIVEAKPGLIPEIEQRLAKGETWKGKSLRHRSDYLLRLLARGAAKTTPRGWFGHVAVVEIGEPGRWWELKDTYAARWMADIQNDRKTLIKGLELSGSTVTVTGLKWTDKDFFHCYVPELQDNSQLREIKVRRTPVLDAILEKLASGGCLPEEIIQHLSPAGIDSSQEKLLFDFIQHLARLGILQLSISPESHLTGWTPLSIDAKTPAKPGFLDLYRTVSGTVPKQLLNRLEKTFPLVTRINAVTATKNLLATHPILDLVNSEPQLVTEILAKFMRLQEESKLNGEIPRETRPHNGISPSFKPELKVPYGRLSEWLDKEPQTAAKQIVITSEILDKLGVPAASPLLWPIDYLIRPLTGHQSHYAVLESFSEAGITDSRLLEAANELYGEDERVRIHKEFLHRLSRQHGAECVEILIPPLAGGSANTIRRPLYTRAWTGDADCASYGFDPEPGGYIPLDQITIRRSKDRFITESTEGTLLWPMYHATKVAHTPWKEMLFLLFAASPIRTLTPPIMPESWLSTFPHRNYIPEIVLEDGLVISPATWRFTRAQLPSPQLPLIERARELASFRETHSLPRWVFAQTGPQTKKRPLDLESLSAFRILDRLLADSTVPALILVEMLPAPADSKIRDCAGDAYAAEIQLRLPYPDIDEINERIS